MAGALPTRALGEGTFRRNRQAEFGQVPEINAAGQLQHPVGEPGWRVEGEFI